MRIMLLLLFFLGLFSMYPILAVSGAADAVTKGDAFFEDGNFRDALNAYDQAIRLDSKNALIYEKKAGTLIKLNRYKEALIAINNSIEIDATSESALTLKKTITQKLEPKPKVTATSTPVPPSTMTSGGKVSKSKDNFYSKSAYLNTGQAATYEIANDKGAQMVLIVPSGANFDFYAIQGAPGSWPSDSYIIEHNEKSDISSATQKQLNLTKGNWYLTVYADSGNGKFELRGTSLDS